MNSESVPRFVRRHPILLGFVVALIAFLLLFNWDWLRPPLERYISKKTQRTFTASHLDVKVGLTPTIILDDLVFGNADWGKQQPMASVKKLEFQVSIRDLIHGKVLVPRAALTDADLLFERRADDRKNWTLSDPSDKSPSRFRIGSLSVNNGKLEYFDYGVPFELTVLASTFDPGAEQKVKNADAKPSNSRYSTRYKFSGKYHDAKFTGNALTGEVLSFQETGVLFPIKGDMAAGTTRLEVEGSVADAANISGIDVDLHVAGETMANVYPFLLLPLPASPPYDLRGHLVLKGDRYTFDKLVGKIGSTDLRGQAGYVNREPRPLLTADLHSDLINMEDLGPLVGVQTKEAKGKPVATQAETQTRSSAASAEKARDQDRVLPAGKFEGSRLQKIDAEVKLETKQLKTSAKLPFEHLRANLHLRDAVLKLEPLDVGFAGGTILSNITLDARQPTIKSTAKVDVRRLRMDRLMPQNEKIADAAGSVGGKLELSGTGNSIADMAARSNGGISAAIAGGRISNLLDAISGLNGGKVITLLVGGDKNISVRCGGVAFDVAKGKGRSTVFVVDTQQTQITGDGNFDLGTERFDMVIEPKPKKPGILSLRTPVRVFGSFRDPQFQLEKGPLVARAGGALALAVINPLAALIPLTETGPGKDTDCNELFKQVPGAVQQAQADPVKPRKPAR